jgi:hypothetical protein
VAGRTRSGESAAARSACGPMCARPKPSGLESTARCSVNCPKGATSRDGVAGGEVRLRLDNVPHGEVCGVLLVR